MLLLGCVLLPGSCIEANGGVPRNMSRVERQQTAFRRGFAVDNNLLARCQIRRFKFILDASEGTELAIRASAIEMTTIWPKAAELLVKHGASRMTCARFFMDVIQYLKILIPIGAMKMRAYNNQDRWIVPCGG